jgi:hypothetical protein
MVLKGREKILLFFVIIAITIWAFDYFYYTPQKKKLSRLKDEVRSADLKLKEFFLYSKGVETIETEVSLLEKELQGFSERTMRGEEFRSFLKHLAKESDRLQMKIISLNLYEEELSLPEEYKMAPPFQYKKVAVQMILRSNYTALGAYLKGIEGLPFFVNVNHLQIEREQETFPFLKVTMGLNVLIMS